MDLWDPDEKQSEQASIPRYETAAGNRSDERCLLKKGSLTEGVVGEQKAENTQLPLALSEARRKGKRGKGFYRKRNDC
jgi:hypothetical protein